MGGKVCVCVWGGGGRGRGREGGGRGGGGGGTRTLVSGKPEMRIIYDPFVGLVKASKLSIQRIIKARGVLGFDLYPPEKFFALAPFPASSFTPPPPPPQTNKKQTQQPKQNKKLNKQQQKNKKRRSKERRRQKWTYFSKDLKQNPSPTPLPLHSYPRRSLTPPPPHTPLQRCTTPSLS